MGLVVRPTTSTFGDKDGKGEGTDVKEDCKTGKRLRVDAELESEGN